MKKIDRIKGCLFGGALGDALGFPVEFLFLSEIKQEYGENGITTLQLNDTGKAYISDDTQMTLFTAEGLLRSETRRFKEGKSHIPTAVYHAYLRWMITQGYMEHFGEEGINNGWLINHRELHDQRAPGDTCLEALKGFEMGTVKNLLNDSKGCGGVMRVAPVGLFIDPERAFDVAVDCAALTHSHPTSYLAAGALAHIVSLLLCDEELDKAVERSMDKLKRYPKYEECLRALSSAVKLAESDQSDVEALRSIGEGWIAEEALAIAVFCALRYRDNFKQALITAVNHDGDSDSTGAITGNILGAYLGVSEIPEEWMNQLELSEVIGEMAEDLEKGYQDTDAWREKYPGV